MGKEPRAPAISSSFKKAVYMVDCDESSEIDVLPCCLGSESDSVANARVCPSGPRTKQGGDCGSDGGGIAGSESLLLCRGTSPRRTVAVCDKQ